MNTTLHTYKDDLILRLGAGAEPDHAILEMSLWNGVSHASLLMPCSAEDLRRIAVRLVQMAEDLDAQVKEAA